MNEFKTKLEIEALKALTYTQINELLNKLTLENKELKEQLRIGSVSKSLKEDYTPTFEQYRNLIYKRQGHNFLNKETQRYMDYEDMKTRYEWHLKNL